MKSFLRPASATPIQRHPTLLGGILSLAVLAVLASGAVLPLPALVGVWPPPSAIAATLCVNPKGTSGCFSSIGAAVSKAAPHDTINVAPGTYKEDVVIGKPLSLIGANRSNTFIDATGSANGIYVDGFDHPGLSNVVVKRFTVENANFEGILVTNASFVTLSHNLVVKNDASLPLDLKTWLKVSMNPRCPGQPSFDTSEGGDCGGGVHLIGVDHSTVSNNIVNIDADGILLTDETGPTHDNRITDNVTNDSTAECGIVLASHPPASGSGPSLGIFRNTIANNESSFNGLLFPTSQSGAGAGVGIFGNFPVRKGVGARASDNLVMNNRITGNNIPGVSFHSHGPNDNLKNNVIVGNYIAGNGRDFFDAQTPGPTGINVFGVSPLAGTVIRHNVIRDEAVDLAVKTPAPVAAHRNDFEGHNIGVANLGKGTVDATRNWWGCSGGPGAPGCTTMRGSRVLFRPWLTSAF